MKGLARWIGYGALGAVAFVWFLYQTFPYQSLKQWVEGTANGALGGAMQVHIAEVAPSWGTGITLRDVQLTMPNDAGKSAAVLTVTEGDLRVGLLGALTGHPRVSYDLALESGAITGDAAWREGQMHIHTEWDQISNKVILANLAKLGIQLDGTVDGALTLMVSPSQWRNAVGTLEVNLHDWKFPKGTVLNLGTFGELELDSIAPNLRLTGKEGSSLECDIGKGAVSITTLQLVGGDIELKLTGKVFLEATPANSRVNLKGTVKFSDALKSNLPVQLLGPADANDGAFPLELTGRLNKLVKRIGNLTL